MENKQPLYHLTKSEIINFVLEAITRHDSDSETMTSGKIFASDNKWVTIDELFDNMITVPSSEQVEPYGYVRNGNFYMNIPENTESLNKMLSIWPDLEAVYRHPPTVEVNKEVSDEKLREVLKRSFSDDQFMEVAINDIQHLISNKKMVKDGFEEWLKAKIEESRKNFDGNSLSFYEYTLSEYLKFQPGEKEKPKDDFCCGLEMKILQRIGKPGGVIKTQVMCTKCKTMKWLVNEPNVM